MLTLEVRVPMKRDRAAVATLYDGAKKLRQDAAAASATEALATAHGNPACDPLRPGGHPPFGRYRLLRHSPTPAGAEKEYGPDLLVFEPERGPALEAESFGRFGLLVYAGSSGADNGRRRTQGGVRLGKSMMQMVLERSRGTGPMALVIEPLDAPVPWWKFWARRPPMQTAALSADPPRFSKPPLDEHSILASLVTARAPKKDLAIDDRDWRDRDSRDWGSSGSSSSSEPFKGGGGGFSGAGASGSWDPAPAARSASGVDSAGRILGTAAAVAGAVAAAEALSGGNEASVAADSDAPAGGGSDSGDTGTSTGTAY